jgi:hypothetical protein
MDDLNNCMRTGCLILDKGEGKYLSLDFQGHNSKEKDMDRTHPSERCDWQWSISQNLVLHWGISREPGDDNLKLLDRPE